MSRAGKSVLAGLSEAAAHARGEATEAKVHRVRVPPKVDVAAVRAQLGLSQAEFAARFGFSKRAIENWEQGDRVPTGSARTLLFLIARAPQTIDELLTTAPAQR